MIRLKNAGAKVASATVALGLSAGAAFAAAAGYSVDVTLPEAVNVGAETLPSGVYHISEMPMGSGESVFLFRDDSGNTAAVVEATKTIAPTDVNRYGASEKTEVVLSPEEDGTMQLNKMFIQGDSAGYRFVNTH